jgi:hypothetical protein
MIAVLIRVVKISMLMAERVVSKPGSAFDGTDRQQDVVIVYGGNCSYCGAAPEAQHCHLLFEKENSNGS